MGKSRNRSNRRHSKRTSETGFRSRSSNRSFEEQGEDDEPYDENGNDYAESNNQADEDDDEGPVVNGPRRTRTRVNYNEDDDDDEDLGEIKDEDAGSDQGRSNGKIIHPSLNSEDGDEEFDLTLAKTRSRSRSRSKRTRHESDESEFQEDSDDDVSDDFVEKLKEKKFIASDDDVDFDHDYITSRRKSKRQRTTSSSRRTRQVVKSDEELSDDNIEDTLQQEIADLQDPDSPSFVKPVHHLRQRKEVDYTIPPQITNDSQLEVTTTPRRHATRRAPANQYRKILFPTAGPFGGSDVISLFGRNIPPGAHNLAAIGDDSDSSDDEIRPINGGVSSTTENTKSNKKLITGSSNTGTEKNKKNSLADSDPLGVDMNIDFSVVGGLDVYIDQLKEMVALPLLYPEVYQRFGITPPRGVLFHGPPGTGKTLMARALAASCSTAERKITFFMRKGADCLSKWVGEAERQLRLLFEEAKQQQPSIIFFDEIDGLAPVRSSKQEQIHASIVSTLLALMDGMDNRGQVIVIGATNRPDAVDPALRRPGRFDREFYFALPDIKARSEILKIHTRKWEPPLNENFVEKIAYLTKGYGGADLRALCTEAALNSIQRKYPQIYKTNEKLKIHPSKIKVVAKDFMKAIEKIVPSSARSASSGSSPLPDQLVSLLNKKFITIKSNLDHLVPRGKKLTTLEEAMYVDTTSKDLDGGFEKQEVLKRLESARVYKPRLLISGEPGMGQQYIGSAILNHLEGFHVQTLDLGSLFEDSTRTPEATIVQRFIESRRHQPSVIYIPNIDIWYSVVPHSAKATLAGLLRSLNSNEKVLLVGISEVPGDELDSEIRTVFGFTTINNIQLQPPTKTERIEFFQSIEKALYMKPNEFNDIESRPKRKLKTLKVLKAKQSSEEKKKEEIKKIEYNDTKLKNTLKIKLAGLMDLFKNRYKRFKKPIIDERNLEHLFDPDIFIKDRLYERLYDKTDNNMIIELSNGKTYHNMDLDVVEERLWNGFYSEPKQFLKDIKKIWQDSVTSEDRERILKANEMLTNAQFGIDEFSTPDFLQQCKEMHEREIARQQKYLEEQQKYEEEQKQKQFELTSTNGQFMEVVETEMLNGIITGQTPDVLTETTKTVISNGDNDIVSTETEIEITETDKKLSSNPLDISNLTNSIDENENLSIENSTEIQNENGFKIPQPSGAVVDIALGKPNSGSESESESESEVDYESSKTEPTKEFTFDEADAEIFLKEYLPDITNGFSVEKLEQINAKLMDVIWADRLNWNRNETIRKLKEIVQWFTEIS